MPKAPQTPSEKVYACFLPSDATEDEVRSMFEKFGIITVLQLKQRKDGFTYAHITYDSLESSRDAITVMHRMRLRGKILNVRYASENCVPKWKKLKDTPENSKELQRPQSEGSIYDIGRKASKKTIKREKQRERKRLRQMIETIPNTLEYFDKIEDALRDVLKLKEQFLALKNQEKIRRKKLPNLAPVQKLEELKEPEPQVKQEAQVERKISISDLSVFQKWLKEVTEVERAKHVGEESETEWTEIQETQGSRENAIDLG